MPVANPAAEEGGARGGEEAKAKREECLVLRRVAGPIFKLYRPSTYCTVIRLPVPQAHRPSQGLCLSTSRRRVVLSSCRSVHRIIRFRRLRVATCHAVTRYPRLPQVAAPL